jgi:L-proline amide hydrolase
VCRVVPFPPEVTETFEQVARNPTVYNVMNGPNEFFVVGSLKTWNVIDRLHKINVPTLIISGRHDEATPACVQPYKDNIMGARWEIFEQSSHMPHIEEKEKCMKLVGAFLAAND